MKRISAILLSALLAFGFVGCTPAKSNTSDNESLLDPSLSQLKCGFSSINELRFCDYSGFYKAALNKDKQYITQGDTSAKYTFKGNPKSYPQFSIRADTEYFGSNDFTKAQALSVDVFNPSNKPHKMWFSFTTSENGDRKVFQKYTEREFLLQPGFNLVSLVIDRSLAAYACDMKNVAYITFRFCNEEEVYDLYFDNLRVHFTEEELVTKTKTYEDDEILFFDNSLDRFFVNTATYMCSPSVVPTLSICRDPRFIHEGNGSLKVQYSSDAGDPSRDETPCVSFSGEAVDRLNLKEYSKLTFKYMSNFDQGRVSLRFRDVNGVGCMYSPVNTVRSKAGEWMDMEVDFTKAKESGLDMEHIALIEMFYAHKTGAEYMFYIDSMRLVK